MASENEYNIEYDTEYDTDSHNDYSYSDSNRDSNTIESVEITRIIVIYAQHRNRLNCFI
jgi:hypothetical protein